MTITTNTLYEVKGDSGLLLTSGMPGTDVTLSGPLTPPVDQPLQVNPQIWTITGELTQAQLVDCIPFGQGGSANMWALGATVDASVTNSGSDLSSSYYFVIVEDDDGASATIASYQSDGTLIGYVTDEQPSVMVRAQNNSNSQKWKFSKVTAGKKPTF